MPRHAKRKLFVHIGLAKTGSTSIQQMLHLLSPSLEQVGVHVVVASARFGNHGGLVPTPAQSKSLPPGRLEGRWRKVFDEVTRCGAPSSVLSAELFSSPWGEVSVERIMALAQAAHLDVEVIACVRPQWQWLESKWAEGVSQMTVLPPFEDWLDTGLADGRLDFARVLAPWRDAFGKVVVVPLERSSLPDGLLVRFLEILGVVHAGIVTAAQQLPRYNLRRGAKLLEIRRLASEILYRHGVNKWQRVYAKKMLAPIAGVLDDDLPFAALTQEQIGEIDRRHAAQNARFARAYEVDANGNLFCDEPVDRFVRPTRAAWTDLSDDERRKVSDLIRQRLGVNLPGGEKVQQGVRTSAGWVTFEEAVAAWPAPGQYCPGDWTRAVWSRVKDCLRGLRQVRLSAQAVMIFKWWRWQVRGAIERARDVAGR